ncbi:hypothetical protein LGN18_10400 [Burkholderia vietnamiensis]|uniref:Uncharacterized protein n=2 Tax=Burkholderiaceae TaxID=119060 RepID=A0A1R1J802_9BURK|nr:MULTISPECIES: DUF6527 family protein [Burkholderia cepacia complex]MCA8447954.1 hypothetical protein [Burkholderia vietnamiensis]MDN7669649.1 DUF6527 family protein [Burkholderia vietnamiensis]OMG71457.1 hypothetical protein BW685_21005 [Burkholderia ubonensis]
MWRPKWLRNTVELLLPARKLTIASGEALPRRLPWRGLVLLRDGEEDWSIAMRCPCGCGQKLELPLIPEAMPRWELRVAPDGRPTLLPSVWLRDGCRSHFFVHGGKVLWV